MKQFKPSELNDLQIASYISHSELWHRTKDIEIVYEDTGPGKFKSNANPGLAARLYDCTQDGWCDDQRGSVDEDGYWSGLLGRFIVTEDNQGFFYYDEFKTESEAERAFRNIG